MNTHQEHIFTLKQQLQEEIEQYEKLLIELVARQAEIKKIETLAASVIEYNQLQRAIEDRTHVFALLSEPLESLRRPLVKSQLFSYFEAAETVGPDLVNELVDFVAEQLRLEIQSGEDDVVELVQAEFKEYIIPGKIIAERFDQIDALLHEMNRYCLAIDPEYNEEMASDVLVYAFQIAIDADTNMPPTEHAIKEVQFEFLTPEQRADLLGHLQERVAILRYDETKNQNLAMEKAVTMVANREEQVG